MAFENQMGKPAHCIFLDKVVEPRVNSQSQLLVFGELEILSITTPVPKTKKEVKLHAPSPRRPIQPYPPTSRTHRLWPPPAIALY